VKLLIVHGTSVTLLQLKKVTEWITAAVNFSHESVIFTLNCTILELRELDLLFEAFAHALAVEMIASMLAVRILLVNELGVVRGDEALSLPAGPVTSVMRSA
jgi:hypothetical protein